MFSCEPVGRALPRSGGWAPAGRCLRFAAVLALWVVAFRADAIAAVFTVTKTADTSDGVCDSDCSLREAVTAANAAPGADAVIVPAGVYVLTQGTSITITGDTELAGAGKGATILDGNRATVVLTVGSDTRRISVSANGFTTRNGYRQGSFGGLAGAGVLVSNASLTLEDADLLGDRTVVGGGGVDGGFSSQLTLRRVTIVDAFSDGISGAVSGANVTLENVEIRGAAGHGLFCSGTCVVSASAIRDNEGWGIGDNGAALISVTDSTLTGNRAPEFLPQSSSGGSITIERSLVYPRPGGSAIYVTRGRSLTVRNSTVIVDADPYDPAVPCSITPAISISNGTNGVPVQGNVVTIESSTIQALTPTGADAAAICIVTYHPNQLSVTNSIVRGQCFAVDPDHLYGGPLAPGRVVSGGGNVESGGDTCTLGDVTDSVGVSAAALGLGRLADNGGSTQTLALDPASVAVNHAVAASCPPVDQRGVSRPQGAGCDSGAYEAEAHCTDADADGFALEGGACGPVDCLDANGQVNPGHAEVPGNGLDDDCNAATSDCKDLDADGYGNPASAACAFPQLDCSDSNANVNPGRTEIPSNGIDDDCNAATPGGCSAP